MLEEVPGKIIHLSDHTEPMIGFHYQPGNYQVPGSIKSGGRSISQLRHIEDFPPL
jgi:hypothetical protein